jgi:putative oxidoreductase
MMSSTRSKTKWITVVVISILVGALFLFAGGTKLAPGAMQARHIEAFTRWGYPIWFMYVVGVIEVGGGLLLFIPATRFYAAVLLACNMIGAVVTHLRAGEMANAPVPVILCLLCAWVAYSTRLSAFNFKTAAVTR